MKVGAATTVVGTKSFVPIAIANGLLVSGSTCCFAKLGLSSVGDSSESDDEVNAVLVEDFMSGYD